MMRTPAYLDMHAEALVAIWRAGWDISLHRTMFGVYFRLEKGILFRGGLRTGWWWRPTVTTAIAKLEREAAMHPRIQPAVQLKFIEPEWEEH